MARRLRLPCRALLSRVDDSPQTGRSGIELPEESKSPGLRGSIFGGLAVAFVGGVLLSNTLFGMSLDWVASWWPAALIIFGVYLAVRAILDRTRPAGPKGI